MLKAYTISGAKAIYTLPDMDRVQFTLNHRTHPSKRNTLKALNEMLKCTNAEVYVHYDFIYIASRYAMFSEDTRKSIISEIGSILIFAERHSQIKGIVMHTDFGLRKEIAKNPDVESVRSAYNAKTWDIQNIESLILDVEHYTENNIDLFYEDLKKYLNGYIPSIKVYLENTTKVSPHGEGEFSHLLNLVSVNRWNDLFGVCFDTEHDFAVNGEVNVDNWSVLLSILKVSGVDFIVHLNTIPEEVKPKSLKDRHSKTTIFECSHFTPQSYLALVEEFENLEIPYIREVHEDTMYRELEQLSSYGIGN